MQGLFSWVLQPMMDRESSPTFMTQGPVLLPAIDGEGQGKGGELLSIIHAIALWTKGKADSPALSPQGWLTCNSCNVRATLWSIAAG